MPLIADFPPAEKDVITKKIRFLRQGAVIEVEKEDLSVDQIACSAFNGFTNLDLLKPQNKTDVR